MRELSTRASVKRRRGWAILASALAALLLLGQARAASSPDQTDRTSSLSPIAGAAHEVRIEFVKPGREGFQFSARLAEDGGPINRPIAWTVRKAGGETVFEGETPIADLAAGPGEYLVHIGYGTVRLAQAVTLLANQRLGVSFVLNVGAIRVLPRIEALGSPPARSETRIFAASGPGVGQLIATSRQPGEIVRVGAGTYRVESRFEPGNTLAVAEVRVKPGLMSAVEIDHRAGLARLRLAGSREATWTLVPAEGEPLLIAGSAVDAVLKPGRYTVRVSSGSRQWQGQFSIDVGEIRTIGPSN